MALRAFSWFLSSRQRVSQTRVFCRFAALPMFSPEKPPTSMHRGWRHLLSSKIGNASTGMVRAHEEVTGEIKACSV